MEQITMYPIGEICSPYKESMDIPIQGTFKSDIEAWIELKQKYADGLKDLDGFSHAIILYYFHKSQREDSNFLPQEKNIFSEQFYQNPRPSGASPLPQ